MTMTTVTCIFRNLTIAGLYFRDKATQDYAKALANGAELTHELEPTNPHDNMAVKLMHGTTFLGYVPANVSPFFYSGLASHPLTLIVSGRDKKGEPLWSCGIVKVS